MKLKREKMKPDTSYTRILVLKGDQGTISYESRFKGYFGPVASEQVVVDLKQGSALFGIVEALVLKIKDLEDLKAKIVAYQDTSRSIAEVK
jgi:hypothetical protein